MREPPVIAFLSTGRCGTQWLTAGLRELHPELDVEHEPIGPLYKPRQYFRRYDDPEAMLEVPELARHVAGIESRTRAYAETGWPLFSVLPLLGLRVPHRLRVVHLTRHPAPTALSHLAHNSYAGSPRDDAYTRWATLGPEDRGVFQPGYAASWGSISPYEKCLFWWTEVHLFALELPTRLNHVPFVRISSEKLLGGDRRELERMLHFMGVRARTGWAERSERVVDRWHHHTPHSIDPLLVRAHPRTMAVAAELGYEAAQIDVEAMRTRYSGEPDAGRDRIGRYETAG